MVKGVLLILWIEGRALLDALWAGRVAEWWEDFPR